MPIMLRRWSTTFFVAFCVISTLWYLSSLTELYAPPSLSNAPIPGTDEFGGVRVHWRKTPKRYPVNDLIQLPSEKPRVFPPLQHEFGAESAAQRSTREERLAAVRKSFVHTWEGYKVNAWMQDELRPISGEHYTSFGGWAATLVDSLDTLWIMDLKVDFEQAVKAAAKIDFTTTETDMLNVFETTIRYLGGFLGAYDISNGQYPVLLEKATQLGEILYCAFDTPNHMPVTRWLWKQALVKAQEAKDAAVIAEVGSLTLEFTRLAQLTGDAKYYDAVARITTAFEHAQTETSILGLWPTVMNAKALTFKNNAFTFGGMADSLYEYLPKEYMLLGGVNNQYKRMYDLAMLVAKRHLFFRPMVPNNDDILISGNAHFNEGLKLIKQESQGQHLGCFTGGMVALGAKIFDHREDLTIARKLVNGCIWAYGSLASGIMPETFHLVPCEDPHACHWNATIWHNAILAHQPDSSKSKSKSMSSFERVHRIIEDKRLPRGYTDIADRRYILRPEAIESIFVLYRITGDRSLMDSAWQMFQAIEKHTKTELAYAAIKDVTVEQPEKDDRMESFWLAETLKYFFLIFSEPDIVSLDQFVL
ncbi:hypothetical protein MMC30_001704 [Trapelia coarctata]|nr:hypothetical protein [Trapelia coarctata]